MPNTGNPLPRWRGFNLLEMFRPDSPGRFVEDDFRWMADWGFDFVRLPMDYRWWTDKDDVFSLKEQGLAEIDRAVDLGRKYGIHVCLNFHRAPGYCVNEHLQEPEPFSLWKDDLAMEAFCFHWKSFAERYRGVPSDRLSFNLVNEPQEPSPERMTRADHERVMRAAAAAIREADGDRLIIIDGVSWGNKPCPELADLGVAQSCRAYLPMSISHYRAPWIGRESWDEPSWPAEDAPGERWDRAALQRHYAKWAELARQGVGVHCGEGGAFRFTPHHVVLRWLRDVLEVLKEYGIGLALWNFRGAFGVLDSQRDDVAYEPWHGHKLDRQLLELLQET